MKKIPASAAAQRRQKKQRAWNRRLRELDEWAAGHAHLDFDDLASGYHSAEVWFGRWPRPFPVRVRRRVVQHLVDIHDRWLTQMQQLEQPYYLGLWIFAGDLIESQVVAGIGEQADMYRERHDPARRAAPPAEYHGKPCDLSRFEWTHHTWTTRELLCNLAESGHAADLRRAEKVERFDGQVVLTFKHEQWLGRLPVRKKMARTRR